MNWSLLPDNMQQCEAAAAILGHMQVVLGVVQCRCCIKGYDLKLLKAGGIRDTCCAGVKQASNESERARAREKKSARGRNAGTLQLVAETTRLQRCMAPIGEMKRTLAALELPLGHYYWIEMRQCAVTWTLQSIYADMP